MHGDSCLHDGCISPNNGVTVSLSRRIKRKPIPFLSSPACAPIPIHVSLKPPFPSPKVSQKLEVQLIVILLKYIPIRHLNYYYYYYSKSSHFLNKSIKFHLKKKNTPYVERHHDAGRVIWRQLNRRAEQAVVIQIRRNEPRSCVSKTRNQTQLRDTQARNRLPERWFRRILTDRPSADRRMLRSPNSGKYPSSKAISVTFNSAAFAFAVATAAAKRKVKVIVEMAIRIRPGRKNKCAVQKYNV